MKIYVVTACYDWEEFPDMIKAFSTETAAEKFVDYSNHNDERYYFYDELDLEEE